MELHLAIKNILKYQGEDFLLDPKMINALIDFQAYDQHPALKNIFRTLHQDGYIKKVKDAGKWDASCDQIVYEIERDYAFPHDLVDLLLKSVAVGLGFPCKLPIISKVNSKPKNSQKATPVKRTWSKMSQSEKENFVKNLIIVDVSFRVFGVKPEDLTVVISEGADSWFNLNYDVKGVIQNTADETQTLAIRLKVKDKNGGIRLSEIIQNLQAYSNGTDVCYECGNAIFPHCKLIDIGAIIMSIVEV